MEKKRSSTPRSRVKPQTNQGVPLGAAEAADPKIRSSEFAFSPPQPVDVPARQAGRVAHELNNVLGVILGYSELLEDYLDARSPAHKPIDEIKKAAGRAISLARQLLALSRESGFQQKEPDSRHD